MDFEKLINLFETNERYHLSISWKIPFFNKSINVYTAIIVKKKNWHPKFFLYYSSHQCSNLAQMINFF